jgi:dihydroflavonol-4-reductase
MPDLLVRLAALALPLARAAVPRLGIVRSASNEKARRLLAWAPRPAEEAILATAESLIRLGVVKA